MQCLNNRDNLCNILYCYIAAAIFFHYHPYIKVTNVTFDTYENSLWKKVAKEELAHIDRSESWFVDFIILGGRACLYTTCTHCWCVRVYSGDNIKVKYKVHLKQLRSRVRGKVRGQVHICTCLWGIMY